MLEAFVQLMPGSGVALVGAGRLHPVLWALERRVRFALINEGCGAGVVASSENAALKRVVALAAGREPRDKGVEQLCLLQGLPAPDYDGDGDDD